LADEVNATASDETNETAANRHCEPTGRANARPMAGSAKQSSGAQADWIASSQELLAMTGFVDQVPIERQCSAAGNLYTGSIVLPSVIALSSVIASQRVGRTPARWQAPRSNPAMRRQTGLLRRKGSSQ
jgi:hypothetical protein